MKSLEDLEKKINSELTTKINKTEIKHNQIYLDTNKDHLVDICLFLKTNNNTKFRQLIDITAVDFPEKDQRFRIVYLLLSHEFNTRVLIEFDISEGEKVPSLTGSKDTFLSSLKALFIALSTSEASVSAV